MKSQENEKPKRRVKPPTTGEEEFAELELSETWRELLGLQAGDTGKQVVLPSQPGTPEQPLPTLADDPWSKLLHAKGIEIVDLQRLGTTHEPLSDQDVEQALQAMQENPNKPKNNNP